MATQHAVVSLPSLTAAHQHQLQQLISTLEAQGTNEHDLAFLRNLSSAMPSFRAGLPADVRSALDELDRSVTAFTSAVHVLSQGVTAFEPACEGGDIPAACLLDVDHILKVTQQAHELSQFAAEVALRGQRLVEQLAQHNEQNLH